MARLLPFWSSILLASCTTVASDRNGSAAEALQRHKLPGILFQSAMHASGYWICANESETKEEQFQAFDRRYGSRVWTLAAEIERRGLDDKGDYIVVTPCVHYTAKQRREALDRFEIDLSALEQQFGILVD